LVSNRLLAIELAKLVRFIPNTTGHCSNMMWRPFSTARSKIYVTSDRRVKILLFRRAYTCVSLQLHHMRPLLLIPGHPDRPEAVRYFEVVHGFQGRKAVAAAERKKLTSYKYRTCWQRRPHKVLERETPVMRLP
jgi:hypothetical protein